MKNRSILSFTIALSSIAPIVAFAAEHGEHHEGPGLLPFIVNFVLFVSLLTYLLKDKIPAAWAARAAKIEEEVTKNERARQAAQTELDKAIREKQKLPETIADINTSIEREQKEECIRIAKEGEESAQRIGKRLHDIVAQEIRTANANYERKLSDAIIELTTSQLSAQWTAAKDEEFARANILSAGTLSALATGGRNG